MDVTLSSGFQITEHSIPASLYHGCLQAYYHYEIFEKVM